MTIWYQAIVYMPKIDEVEVIHETASSVVINGGRRRAKETDREAFFKTEAEAVEWLIKHATMRRDTAQDSLERAQKWLDVRLTMRKGAA